MPTIRELREAKGWSQQELATRASLGIHTVGRLERGDEVNRSSFLLVCQALSTTPEDVTGVNVVNRVSKKGADNV